MNALQSKELELLRCFDSVCKELSIKYFLVCGSALGAEKYGGFIPWDDDVDVGLFREDYDKFTKEAQAILPKGFFLQNADTDPAFPQIYAKLRDSQTTFLERSARNLPINHGVFIDIFPLDGYPHNRFAQKRLELRKRVYNSMLLSAYDIPREGVSSTICKIWKAMQVPQNTQKVVKRFDKCITKYPVHGSEVICNHGNWQGKLEYAPLWQYGRGKKATFEGLSVLIPEAIDAYLTQKYGNWRADLPIEKQQGHHTCEYCSCETSYINYLNGEKIYGEI